MRRPSSATWARAATAGDAGHGGGANESSDTAGGSESTEQASQEKREQQEASEPELADTQPGNPPKTVKNELYRILRGQGTLRRWANGWPKQFEARGLPARLVRAWKGSYEYEVPG